MTDEVDRLMAGIAGRKVRDLARAITLVENGGPDGLELLRRLAEQARGGADRPRSHVVGVTGSPGWAVHDDRGTDYGVPCPRSVGCCCCCGSVFAVFRRCAAR